MRMLESTTTPSEESPTLKLLSKVVGFRYGHIKERSRLNYISILRVRVEFNCVRVPMFTTVKGTLS
jgi:hypothetical protein